MWLSITLKLCPLTWQLEERHFLWLHCGADVGYLLMAGGLWLVGWCTG